MGIEVEGPDGQVHTFPDGTSNEQINSQMSQKYGSGGSLQPQEPRAGDATPASGAIMPGMQSVPGYRSAEDWDQLALTKMFPHAASVIQNTPGHQQRIEQARTVGKNLGNLEERQRGGLKVLDMLHQLGETADEGHRDGNLESAIGPLESSAIFQKARAIVPGLGSYYDKAYNLHNQLNHDIEGLVTAFISAAGKGGINMSDARQKAFHETMGAMMNATSKEEFDKIKKDAERIIKGTFDLAPGAKVDPTNSSRSTVKPPQPVRQQFRNKTTGAIETMEWDGKQWHRVH